MQPADVQWEAAAARIASTGANSPDGTNLDVVDPNSEMVAFISSRNLFEASVASRKTADQMKKKVIALKG